MKSSGQVLDGAINVIKVLKELEEESVYLKAINSVKKEKVICKWFRRWESPFFLINTVPSFTSSNSLLPSKGVVISSSKPI
jgi:hypothetical protein